MKAPREKIKLRSLLRFLPKGLRFWALRRALRIVDHPPEDLEFKIATTQDELEQAYRILYDSYVEYGFQRPNPSGLRIIKYFALPTTTTLIAKLNDTVIGTMSIVRKGPFGLPMEDIFDLGKIEVGGKIIAEVSSLAIAREFRYRRGVLFLPLCKYFFTYIKNYMHLDGVVIAVNPSWADFYEGLLLFSPLEKKPVGKYDFANGAPAVAFWSEVSSWDARFEKVYGQRPRSQNLYHYLVELKLDSFRFPNREYEKALDPILTPEMLNYFFRQKSRIFETLTDIEIRALRSCYSHKSYNFVLPKADESNVRSAPRFLVFAMGESDPGKGFKVLEASMAGVKLQGPLPRRTAFDFLVHVSSLKTAKLNGLIRWIDQENNLFGVEIMKFDETWKEYLDYIKMDFNNWDSPKKAQK